MEENLKNQKNKLNSRDQVNKLWKEILSEALSKKDLVQSHLFIFGDKNTGKKSIIKNINKDFLNKVEFYGNIMIYRRCWQKGY